MPEPLFPDEAKKAYSALIESGTRSISPDDPTWDESGIRWLFEAGLVGKTLREISRLAPTIPVATFERLLARSQRELDASRRRFDDMMRISAALQQRFLRSVPMPAMSTPCQLVIHAHHVSALQNSLMCAGAHEVLSWVTGPYGNPEVVGDTFAGDSSFGYLAPDAELLGHGGHSRVLYDREFVTSALPEMERAYAEGEEMRVVAKLPMKLVVVDDHTALVPLGPYGTPALLIRSRPMVALFRAFFELVWHAATPWPASENHVDDAERAARRPILELLAAGLKDDAIARRLGLSARTVRRYVAEMMRELGVSTRFAAGVAAVRAGWLDSP